MIDYRKVAVFGIVPVLGYFFWIDRPVHQPDGILVPNEPFQEILKAEERLPTKINEAAIEPLARYRITARVLSKERYRFDHGAKVSPIDLALGWGPMSDNRILDKLGISQGHRYYHLSWREPPLSETEIMRHSANVHVIPANDLIKKEVLNLKVGDIVELQGSLVMVSDKGGSDWKSSLTRDDTGNGACELMYVERVSKK